MKAAAFGGVEVNWAKAELVNFGQDSAKSTQCVGVGACRD